MSLSVGTRLGPYEIQSALGAGGMGEVYKARDTRLDRTVAIKILPEALAGDPHFRERLDREARAISQLDHPNICALYDIGEQDGASFLVMQYLEGETLQDRLSKGALPLDQVFKVATAIASALDKAHRAGIARRDLKPGNIMLTKTGGHFCVRLGCLRDADREKAFAGKSQATLIAAIINGQPAPVSQLQPLTPPALEQLAATCLAKEPDDRFHSAHDLLLPLRWIAAGGLQAGVPAPIVARRKIRERLLWTLAGASTLAALSLALVVIDRQSKRRRLALRSTRRHPGTLRPTSSPSRPTAAVSPRSVPPQTEGKHSGFVLSIGSPPNPFLGRKAHTGLSGRRMVDR